MPDTRPGIKFVRLDEFGKAQIQGKNANLSKSDNHQGGGILILALKV